MNSNFTGPLGLFSTVFTLAQITQMANSIGPIYEKTKESFNMKQMKNENW